ncbi:MAG: S46 family peptidase [Flavobacteriales bacterium]|nr:S46 family peptidase [Flavobacteriales bacterium]
MAAVVALSLIPSSAKADEGMWLPMFLNKNMEEMQRLGLQLTPEQLYDINNSSLKDAIVSFGGFCTGEIISSQGLVLTNHHCGYDAIQTHSVVEEGAPEKNILDNGFWAQNHGEEKPNEGLFVDFLVRMDDVTKDILSGINDNTSEEERAKKISERIQSKQQAKSEGGKYIVKIKSFFDGNEYYMFTYQRYNDVRLVGTPPQSIGKYGGDTDNWMWPRQTGDFSLFRVYAAPDGSPAHYSTENIPLEPKHHLPISMKGVKKGDFSMIWGYPGSTDRYLTSYGVKQAIEVHNPTIVDIRRTKLDVLDKHMAASDKVRIQYSSKYANVANYWKYFIGQTKGLKRLNVFEKKQEIENNFREWRMAKQHERSRYNAILHDIKNAYENNEPFVKPSVYAREAALTGSDMVLFALRMSKTLEYALKEGNEKAKPMVLASMDKQIDDFFKDYDPATDKELFITLMKKYDNDIADSAMKPDFFQKVKCGGFEKYAKKAYKKTMFADAAKLKDFVKDPSLKKLKKDPFYKIQNSVFTVYQNLSEKEAKALEKSERATRLFVDGLRKMDAKKNYYPNANFTMRCTYGTVQDYYPQDAVHYNYFTTMEGLIEKMDNSNPEFVVPQKMVDLHKAKDYGQYADADGKLHICFTSNNDITGGNSGSPVINGNGELIGCAFDGNWEAMSGDIAFETNLQRTISVDIRYVLWVIDKFSGAGHIVDEMTLVK